VGNNEGFARVNDQGILTASGKSVEMGAAQIQIGKRKNYLKHG